MSDTPRTDAKRTRLTCFATVPVRFARQLEKELVEANSKIEKLNQQRDAAFQAGWEAGFHWKNGVPYPKK